MKNYPEVKVGNTVEVRCYGTTYDVEVSDVHEARNWDIISGRFRLSGTDNETVGSWQDGRGTFQNFVLLS